MKYSELLISKNLQIKQSYNRSNIKITNNTLFVTIPFKEITLQRLKTIINMLSVYICKEKLRKICVQSTQKEVFFADKLSFLLFENLLYYLTTNFNKILIMKLSVNTDKVKIAGLKDSLLYKLINRDITSQEFSKKYKEKLLSSTQYRTLISADAQNDHFSIIMGELSLFLSCALNNYENDNKDLIDDIAEFICELCSNAWEHSKTDCLLDINVSDNWVSKTTNKNYFAINIVVLNYSETILSNKLEHKMFNNHNIKKIPDIIKF